MQRYISFNGIIKTEILSFGPSNRSFRYGDGLFESIRVFKGTALHLSAHLHRLNVGAKLLGIKGVELIDEVKVSEQIMELYTLNSLKAGAKARLQIYRKDGGLYRPNSNYCDWFIELEPLENEKYCLNQKGLFVDIYTELPKPTNLLSGIKTTNALYYVLAGVFANNNSLDDAILVNQSGNLVEAISSNLFLVKGNNIVTTPLSEGPVDGVIRNVILDLKIKNYHFIESPITKQMLLNADEVFLTNAIKGIQWVVGFQQKRYFNKAAKIIEEILNKKFYSESE